MTSATKQLDRLIQNVDSFNSQFMHFCLSDQLPIDLRVVTTGSLSPIEYADRLAHSHGVFATERFFQPAYSKKYHKQMTLAWAYDQFLATALFYKTLALFEGKDDRVEGAFYIGNIYTLSITDPNYPASVYGGITSFANHAKQHQKQCPQLFTGTDSIALNQALNAFSSSASADWLFLDPRWQYLLAAPVKLKYLRRFLHTSYMAYINPEEAFNSFYSIEKDDIPILLYDFTELIKDMATTQKDIDEFISRLKVYFDAVSFVPPLDVLLKYSYDKTAMFYQDSGNPQLFQHRLVEQSLNSVN